MDGTETCIIEKVRKHATSQSVLREVLESRDIFRLNYGPTWYRKFFRVLDSVTETNQNPGGTNTWRCYPKINTKFLDLRINIHFKWDNKLLSLQLISTLYVHTRRHN